MLFASYEFIFFLLCVFIIYYILPGKYQWIFLLIASYVFYFVANPFYLVFITTTSFTIYYAAQKMERLRLVFKEQGFPEGTGKEEKKALKAKEKSREKKWMLAALLLNLGILAVLKYTNFAIANINSVAGLFGSGMTLERVNIILPMGISFYTFQAVSYLIDIYHGKYEAQKSFFRFALFVSFFPQLVQGPISRYSDLAASLYEPHKPEYKTVSFGIQRILWGFFKKLVIADRILVAVNSIIHDPDTYNGLYVFMGMMFYALELYADFTGGIDITIGVAQTMGIKVAENFERPYFSKNIKEYWKRWHITMGTWFTDYIFYPLSVSKFMRNLNKFARKHFGDYVGKRLPVYFSSFIVWLTTGIWHGASWNFIVWGLGNYVVIMISEELSPFYDFFHKHFDVQDKKWYRCFQIVRTVLIMSCLRMFDCYRDVPLTFRMFGTMFSRFNLGVLNAGMIEGLGLKPVDYIILLLGTVVLITVSLIQRKGSVREQILSLSIYKRYCIWFGLFLIIILFGAYGIGYDESQFIYNQF